MLGCRATREQPRTHLPPPRPPSSPLRLGGSFVPGLIVLAATVLIPAFDDVKDAQWKRDRVLAIEKHRLDRIQHYVDYVDAVDRGDESVVLSLAASQLNMVPEEAEPLAPPD